MKQIQPHLCKKCGATDPEQFYGLNKSICKKCYGLTQSNTKKESKDRLKAIGVELKYTEAEGNILYIKPAKIIITDYGNGTVLINAIDRDCIVSIEHYKDSLDKAIGALSNGISEYILTSEVYTTKRSKPPHNIDFIKVPTRIILTKQTKIIRAELLKET